MIIIKNYDSCIYIPKNSELYVSLEYSLRTENDRSFYSEITGKTKVEEGDSYELERVVLVTPNHIYVIFVDGLTYKGFYDWFNEKIENSYISQQESGVSVLIDICDWLQSKGHLVDDIRIEILKKE